MSDKQAPYKLTGQVILVKDEEHISDKFSKKTVVVDTDPNGKYHNPVAIDFINDKAELVEEANAGDTVEVRFYLGGYQGKKDPSYYGVNCKGMQYDVIEGGGQQAPEPEQPPADDSSDLPF